MPWGGASWAQWTNNRLPRRQVYNDRETDRERVWDREVIDDWDKCGIYCSIGGSTPAGQVVTTVTRRWTVPSTSLEHVPCGQLVITDWLTFTSAEVTLYKPVTACEVANVRRRRKYAWQWDLMHVAGLINSILWWVVVSCDVRHWPTAQWMIRWSKRRHSWISDSFKWSTSRIWQLYTRSCKISQIAYSQPDWDPGCLVASTAARWSPASRPTAVQPVSRGSVLLKREERSRYWTNGWLKILPPQ